MSALGHYLETRQEHAARVDYDWAVVLACININKVIFANASALIGAAICGCAVCAGAHAPVGLACTAARINYSSPINYSTPDFVC